MTRLILILLVIVLFYRWAAGRWPWQPNDRKRAWARAQARAVLGVTEDASREAIVDAHRRLITRIHPDRGGTKEQVHEANSARDLLLGDIVRQSADRA